MIRITHKLHVFVTILLVLTVMVPFIPLVLSSFSHGWVWPYVLPATWSLRGWRYVFSNHAGTWPAIWASLEIALSVTMINLIVALPAASALGRNSFRGKLLIQGILYTPLVVPSFVSIMGMYVTFIRLNLTETIAGVVLAHLVPTLPYMVQALTISFSTLGSAWEEQARMLGAGRLSRFMYVVLPHILPGIIAGASLNILVSMSQYLITFLMGGGQVVTLTLLMFPFINGGDPVIGSAYAILFAASAGITLFIMDISLRKYYGQKIHV
jgi:ABC-type spermidine/putrescine transport system, permease component II